MAEIRAKENEIIESEKVISSKPSVLSSEQRDFFTQLIKDDPLELKSDIFNLKKAFPNELGNVTALTDDQKSNLLSTDFTKLQSRLNNYKKQKKTQILKLYKNSLLNSLLNFKNYKRSIQTTLTAFLKSSPPSRIHRPTRP